MNGDVSGVKQHYIASTGVYLQGDGTKEYDYSEKNSTSAYSEEDEEQETKLEEHMEQEIVTVTNDISDGEVVSI